MKHSSIIKSQEFFNNRDKADSEELMRDVNTAISSAVAQQVSRLIVFTNVNSKVIKTVIDMLDPKALKELNLSVQILNPTPEQEIELRHRAMNANCETLIADTEVSGGDQKVFLEA